MGLRGARFGADLWIDVCNFLSEDETFDFNGRGVVAPVNPLRGRFVDFVFKEKLIAIFVFDDVSYGDPPPS